MSQRVTSFILNCGPGMSKSLPGHEKSLIQEGVEIIMDSLGDKLLADRKTDKVNVIFSGTQGNEQ
ncbi:unnamed protein product [Absidia cylindrospora]